MQIYAELLKINPNGENLRDLVINRIKSLSIVPNKNLGQHFLIDEGVINILANSVILGSTVIEVGAGVGQLTESLAKKAAKVVAIEIDVRYRPILSQIEKTYSNVHIIYDDVLALDLNMLIEREKQAQIVASLPYHITEPFLHKITTLPMYNATLVVGKRLMHAITQKENQPEFGQLSLLAQTFFIIEVLGLIDKKMFFPIPRTDSAIIRLTPKNEQEINSSVRDFLLKRLFLTANRGPLVKNCLKEGLIELARITGKTLTQNQARKMISEISIPDRILNKSFQQLNNEELRILSIVLRRL